MPFLKQTRSISALGVQLDLHGPGCSRQFLIDDVDVLGLCALKFVTHVDLLPGTCRIGMEDHLAVLQHLSDSTGANCFTVNLGVILRRSRVQGLWTAALHYTCPLLPHDCLILLLDQVMKLWHLRDISCWSEVASSASTSTQVSVLPEPMHVSSASTNFGRSLYVLFSRAVLQTLGPTSTCLGINFLM